MFIHMHLIFKKKILLSSSIHAVAKGRSSFFLFAV